MIMVEHWTGTEARLLRQAMRLSVQDFAARLGRGQRTVAEWESKGCDYRPRHATQADLDVMLAQRASSEDRERFAALLQQTRQDEKANGSADPNARLADEFIPGTAGTYATRGEVTREKWNAIIAGSISHLWLYGMAEFGFASDPEVPGIMAAAASRGCDIRVLLLDPDYPGTTELDIEEGNPPGTLGPRIRAALATFQQMQADCAPNMAIRVYGARPTMSVVRGDSRMLLTPYVRFFIGRNSPTFELGAGRTGTVFDHYARHVDHVWAQAREWES